MSLAEQYMHREFRRLAIQFVMRLYDISEEDAMSFYKDEINAAERLMKIPEFREFVKEELGKNKK